MNKLFVMSFLAPALMLPSQAADTLEILGKVTRNSRAGTPESEVRVIEERGGEGLTAKDGQFKLGMEQPADGWVKLRLVKEGLVTVNALALRQPVPKGTKLRFAAAVATAQEGRDRTDDYWSQELLRLHRSQAKPAEIKDSESTEAVLRRYGEWLAAIKPEEPSETWFRIFHDWVGGHFEQAKRGLDAIDFAAVKSAEEARRLRHLAAAISFTRNNLKEALKAAEAAVVAFPEDSFSLLMQARLFNLSGDLPRAREIAERLLSKPDADVRVQAQAAHILAINTFKAGDMKQAIRHLEKTVSFYDLVLNDRSSFAEQRRVAEARVSFALGIWQTAQDGETAVKAIASGLALHRKLARKYPDLDGEHLGEALDSAASLHGLLRDMPQAMKLLQEEADLNRELAKAKPGKHLPLLARTLGRQGQFSWLQRKADEALPYYDEALKVVMSLSQPSREEGHLPLVCTLLRGRGEALVMLGRLADAESSFKQALTFHQELGRISPGKLEHLTEQAVIWQKLAELYFAQGQAFAAAQAFSSAGQICSALVERGVESQRPSAFMCYKNVAAINHQAKQYQDALKYALLAGAHSAKIESQAPDRHEALAELELLTALLLGKEKKMEDARPHAMTAVRLYRGLAKKDAAAFGLRLGQALTTLSELSPKEDAEPLLQEAQKLLERHPDGPEASLLREALRLLKSGKSSVEL